MDVFELVEHIRTSDIEEKDKDAAAEESASEEPAAEEPAAAESALETAAAEPEAAASSYDILLEDKTTWCECYDYQRDAIECFLKYKTCTFTA